MLHQCIYMSCQIYIFKPWLFVSCIITLRNSYIMLMSDHLFSFRRLFYNTSLCIWFIFCFGCTRRKRKTVNSKFKTDNLCILFIWDITNIHPFSRSLFEEIGTWINHTLHQVSYLNWRWLCFDFRIMLVYLFENVKYDKCNVMKLSEYLLRYTMNIFVCTI